MAKILIAEDDGTSALLLERTLLKAGHEVRRVADGIAAFEVALREGFDVLLADWMMPGKDGLELIGDLRARLPRMPLTMVVTALASAEARQQAFQAGADDYLAKPYRPAEVLERLATLLARQGQSAAEPEAPSLTPMPARRGAAPDHLAVGIATSTGGPEALCALFGRLSPQPRAAFLVAMPGPAWVLDSLAAALAAEATMPVRLAADHLAPLPGGITLARGDRHLYIDPEVHDLRLSDAPAINYVKPAADPLLQSIAHVYRECGVGVVLTGLGRDGARGVQQIHRFGGRVLVQEPSTAAAPDMPTFALETGIADAALPLPELAAALDAAIAELTPHLPAPQTAP
ncbi:response regulator [bacterium]|nr:response regulator [bacterium]